VAGQVLTVHVREGDRVKKGDALLLLDPTDYAREVARAEAEVLKAKNAIGFAELAHARAVRGVAQSVATPVELETKDYELAERRAALKTAEVALATAQDRVRYTRIVAPLDGTVIQRGIEPGEVVTPGIQSTFEGKPLLTVADLSTLLVKVNLNQIDVAKVSVGREATLTLDALPGKTYHAVVTKVAPASVKPQKDKDLEVFPIEAEIRATDGLIKPGMTADVRVHLDAKDNVLFVPVEAVIKEGGKNLVVKVLDDGSEKGKPPRTERVEVETGVRNDREVELVTGIGEGDRVLIHPPPPGDAEMKF
jgi:RND family efflux transporter MFP subunit